MFNNMNVKKAALWLAVIAFGSLTLAAVIFYYSDGEGILRDPEVNIHDNIKPGDPEVNIDDNIIKKIGVSIHGKFTKEIDEEKSLELAGLKDLSISSTSTDIKIIPTDGQTVKAHLYGTISSNKEDYFPALEAERTGDRGSINIKWPRTINIGFMNSDLKLDIYLPRTYAENLDVDTSSAKVSFDELTVKGFQCSTTSGDVTGKSVKAESAELKTSSGRFELSTNITGNLHIESTSGDFNLNTVKAKSVTRATASGVTKITNMECEDFKFNSTSGDLKVESIKAAASNIETSSGKVQLNGPSSEKAVVKTTSGDIYWEGLVSKSTQTETFSGKTTLKGALGDLNHHSTSGDIEAAYDNFSNNIKIEVSSGMSKLQLPSNSEFGLNYSSSSGKMHLNDFEVTVKGPVEDNNFKGYVKSDKNMITIKSSSGDAEISRK